MDINAPGTSLEHLILIEVAGRDMGNLQPHQGRTLRSKAEVDVENCGLAPGGGAFLQAPGKLKCFLLLGTGERPCATFTAACTMENGSTSAGSTSPPWTINAGCHRWEGDLQGPSRSRHRLHSAPD